MSTMVVQAHPVALSYNTALLERVCRGLDTSGQAHVVRRLGEGERPGAAEMAGVDRLILVYPTWGGGQPAVLLDWLQEMLAAGAFASVEQLQVATTHGSSQLTNRLQGEWGRRFLSDRVAPSSGSGASLDWHALYKVDRLSTDQISRFLDETEDFFARRPTAAT